jgi:hypothetical protein
MDSHSPEQACFKRQSVSSFSSNAAPMENVIVDLTKALRERLAIVHDEKSRDDETAHLARLQAVSEKIDNLEAALPRPIDPQLAHYLKRRSYDKALEFLKGRGDSPNRAGD